MGKQFKEQTVIITGAAGGLGKAVSRKFYECGAQLALLDIDQGALERSIWEVGIPSESFFAFGCDITQENQVKNVVCQIAERFGHLDVLCNIAGICGPSARAQDYTFQDLQQVYRVNVFGTFLMMQAVLPFMIQQGRGVITNTGSVSGIDGYPFEIGYGSSKAAVIAMTKNAANENGGNGVRINAVSPGWIDTAMMRTVVSSYENVGIEDSSDNVTLGPLGRPCTADEVADVYVYLASEGARIINGANLLADGGMILG